LYRPNERTNGINFLAKIQKYIVIFAYYFLTIKMVMEQQNKSIRPSWDEYFMEIARTVAQRATCDRGKSGCVIVRDRQILVSGYVGSPKGLPHCDDVGHLFKKVLHDDGSITNHCMRTVHAEQNAICQAAKLGISLNDATLYCKMTPCRTCAMLIINCGIRRVVCEKKYHAGAESEEMFHTAGVELEFFENSVEQYEKQ
jgi:dCMP deaminase